MVTMEKRKEANVLLSFLLLLSSQSLSVDANTRDYRLPPDLIPSHYSLDLILDPRATTFGGLVEIAFTATDTKTDIIRLHASSQNIEIEDALLNYQHNCNITDHDDATDIVTFEYPENSLLAENSVIIHFKGTYSLEDMHGLYKSTYKEGDEEIPLVATQFESVEGRRAFPCFDEPVLKATFDIFITHPNDYNAIANTPAVKQFSVGPDQTQTQFETTPVMSTYLVAFIVSKFVSNSNPESTKYDYKVWSRPSAKDYTNVATSYGPTLIGLLSEWTGIDYYDLGDTQAYQVAIPDFAAGAMENWGLITFKEVDLLDEKDITSNSAKQRIIATVAHELSHQWFGDYVTLDWWSDTWLNEGFATYFEYYIPSLLEDNLDTMKQFVVNELQPVLQVDALTSAKALTSDASTAVEIDDKFDDISYSKGGSVIRMFRNVIGEQAFKKGLHSYLVTNKYSNTNPTVLLNSFKAVTDLEIEKIMTNWIYKSGYPLVTAKLDGSTVIVTQERFILQNSSDAEATEWYVPISHTNGVEKNFDINITDWLEPKSKLQIDLNDKSWIIFNLQQAGYYRVNYDDTLWHRIINALNKEREDIHVLNRAQVLDDVFNIARAGQVGYETAFHLADFLTSETEYYPWVSALNAMSFISGKLNDAETERLLRGRILFWIAKAFSTKNAKEGGEHVEKLKDVLIQDWSCKLGEKACNAYVDESFKKYKDEAILDDYNRRGVVLCYGFRNSKNPEEDYEFLFNLFKATPSVVLQNEIIRSLGCTEDSNILTKYLLETISKNSSIRRQDCTSVFKSVYSQSETGLNVSLNFLENNLQDIVNMYSGLNALPNLILGLAKNVILNDHIDRLTKIISDHSDIEEVKIVGQTAIDIVTTNRKWTDTYAAVIKKILKTNSNEASASEPTLMFFMIVFSVFYLFHR